MKTNNTFSPDSERLVRAVSVAVDFGAGSGRVMVGDVQDDGTVQLHQVHRFPNRQVQLGDRLYWDFPALFADMVEGLRLVVQQGWHIDSIGIDTWGVDFGLLDAHGRLLGLPVCYRDTRTDGEPQRVFPTGQDLDAHYAEAGIQVMNINTLFQLTAMMRDDQLADASPGVMSLAHRLLFMPDLFSYFLTGVANNEYCIASTSELLDAKARTWNWTLIDRLGLPRRLFGDIVMPGTMRGVLLPHIKQQLGVDYDIPVVAVASHDTASGVAATMAATAAKGAADSASGVGAFLSSGTWSLLGVVLDAPVLSPEARRAGFTNEGGVDGKIRFLQNITGLWFLQQLMAQWDKDGRHISYPDLDREATAARIDSVIDVDAPVFFQPGDMEGKIAAWCSEHGMQVPRSQGETARVALQSLAKRYARAISHLNTLLPAPVTSITVFGGGSQNPLLNTLTARETGLPVITGEVEATAIGNVMVQHQALIECKTKR